MIDPAHGILDIRDLGSRLAQKHAEQREVEAKLRLLESGTRPEEIAEQKQKVQRAQLWHRQRAARWAVRCERIAYLSRGVRGAVEPDRNSARYRG